MNTRVIDVIEELWMKSGESSDLDPWLDSVDPYDATASPDTGFDVNSRGVQYYLQQLSRAQTAIANWRKQRGHEVRFKKFITNKNIIVGLENSTFDFRPYGTFGVSLPVSEFYGDIPTTDMGIFEGSFIEIDSTKYPVIMSEYDAGLNGGSVVFTFYDSVAFDTTAFSVEGVIYMSQFTIKTDGVSYEDGYYVQAPTSLVEVLKMYDGPTSARMTRPSNKDSLYNQPPSYGVPSQWYVIGDKLYFDTAIEGKRFFQIEYYRVPTPLTAATRAALVNLRFEIPDYFIEAVVLWVEWQQMRLKHEFDKAYAIKQDLKEVIERFSTENSFDMMRDEASGFFVQKEETY